MDTLDEQTLNIIIQIYEDDLQELETAAAASARRGEHQDGITALALSINELKQQRGVLRNRHPALGLAGAPGEQHAGLHENRNRENDEHTEPETLLNPGQAADDTISENEPAPGEQDGLHSDSAALPQLADLQISEEDQALTQEPDGQAHNRRQCIICSDPKEFAEAFEVPCGHFYCHKCIEELFRHAEIDESLFPPSCCRQAIPIDLITAALPQQLIDTFAKKQEEHDCKDRTYCSNPSCSRFISPRLISNNVGTCGECNLLTCTICKAASHDGDCPKDPEIQVVLELARKEGWQPCPNCKRVIQLAAGCYHITCKCSHQFCYLCAARWKQCDCPQWHERRLLDRANDVVGRHPAADGIDRAEQVLRAANRLEERHNCTHEHYRFVHGRSQCERCNQTMDVFTYECERCELQVCRRCRYNRLGG